MQTIEQKISRRDWLKFAGASAAYTALTACTTLPTSRKGPPYARPISPLPFYRPHVDASQIIKTLVGLRPYREAGFVVRGEIAGEKIIIHNYGHGGGGITMSWGSSALAVAEAPDIANKKAAVIGCGVMGLSTARLLQQRGWDVTIYAKDLPPNTTSNIAGGQWAPTSVFSRYSATPVFLAQFKQALLISHQMFSKLVGVEGYGVSLKENYHCNSYPTSADNYYYLREFPQLFPAIAELKPDEHPFDVPYVLRYLTMLIEPSIYLPRLMKDMTEAGGKIVMKNFQDQAEILAPGILNEPVIFNCAGLGARELFNDSELTPVRGQLVLLKPDERIDYMTHGGGDGLMYMFPRADGILLGGAYERGQTNMEPDIETSARILNEHAAFFQRMKI